MVLSFDNLSIDLKRHKVRHFIKYTHKEACNYPTQLGKFIAKMDLICHAPRPFPWILIIIKDKEIKSLKI